MDDDYAQLVAGELASIRATLQEQNEILARLAKAVEDANEGAAR